MRVYIAGPYTKGTTAVNVRNAVFAGEAVFAAGHSPYVPHLTHVWELLFPHDWDWWMTLDSEWLVMCDALIRLPGESKGADVEVKEAYHHELEVFFGVEEFLNVHGKDGKARDSEIK